MIERELKTKLLELAKKYPIITVTGPRQSGKSTLLKNAFPGYKYVSLEDLDMRAFATDDPRGFLATYPTDYYPFYILTYEKRDLRMMKNIGDLSKFIKFIKLCAGRIGQLLNYSSLANDCGVAVSTVSSWISILEASNICYLLKPDFNNYAKRLVKSPKLYFFDTGLACSLLDIKSAGQVVTHFLRGGLFENLVINEFVKEAYNKGGNR